MVLALAACKHAAPAEEPAEAVEPAPTAETDCVPIYAQQHIVDHPCVLAPQQVGCMAPDTACGDAITYARDDNNQTWWFMDTCIPDGWTVEPYPPGDSPPPSC